MSFIRSLVCYEKQLLRTTCLERIFNKINGAWCSPLYIYMTVYLTEKHADSRSEVSLALVQFSTGKQAVLIEDFTIFFRPLRQLPLLRLTVGHWRFIPRYFLFIFHRLPYQLTIACIMQSTDSCVNHLRTKPNLFYLKAKSVPRSIRLSYTNQSVNVVQ